MKSFEERLRDVEEDLNRWWSCECGQAWYEVSDDEPMDQPTRNWLEQYRWNARAQGHFATKPCEKAKP